MKNNIDWYPHYTNSDEHPKFKMLRVKYGWEGEGKFWALNNRIAEAEGCHINLTKKYNKAGLANDLGFTVDELEKFLKYLEKECSLIIRKNNYILTKRVKSTWEKVDEKRKLNKKQYEKLGKQDDHIGVKPHKTSEKAIQTSKKKIQTSENTHIRLEKIKEKEIKKEKKIDCKKKEDPKFNLINKLFLKRNPINKSKTPEVIKQKLIDCLARAVNVLTEKEQEDVFNRCKPGQAYEYYIKAINGECVEKKDIELEGNQAPEKVKRKSPDYGGQSTGRIIRSEKEDVSRDVRALVRETSISLGNE